MGETDQGPPRGAGGYTPIEHQPPHIPDPPAPPGLGENPERAPQAIMALVFAAAAFAHPCLFPLSIAGLVMAIRARRQYPSCGISLAGVWVGAGMMLYTALVIAAVALWIAWVGSLAPHAPSAAHPGVVPPARSQPASPPPGATPDPWRPGPSTPERPPAFTPPR